MNVLLLMNISSCFNDSLDLIIKGIILLTWEPLIKWLKSLNICFNKGELFSIINETISITPSCSYSSETKLSFYSYLSNSNILFILKAASFYMKV